MQLLIIFVQKILKSVCKFLMVSEHNAINITFNENNPNDLKVDESVKSSGGDIYPTPSHCCLDQDGIHTSEWKLLAEVVQRIFFIVFVVINIVVLIIMFIRFYFLN